MRVALLISLLLFSISSASAQDIPAGSLGYPLGKYLTVEGTRAEEGLVGVNTLLVDTVNGKKLDTPVSIWVDNVAALPKGTRCVLRGYESGRMIGTPSAVIEAAKEDGKDIPLPQATWQFHHFFIVLSALQPKDLQTTPPKAR